MRGLIIVLILLLGFTGNAFAGSPAEDEGQAGFMAFAMKDYDGSIEHYTKAIVLETDKLHLSQLYNQRGFVYDLKGSYDQALADLSQAIALQPDYALAFSNRGHVLLHQGLYDQALADANKAVTFADNDNKLGTSTLFEYRAEIYEKLGQRDNAIADYRKALSLVPALHQDAKDGLARLGAGS